MFGLRGRARFCAGSPADQNLDRDDRDRLATEDPFIGHDLAGDPAMRHEPAQALHVGERIGRERRLDRIQERVDDRRGRRHLVGRLRVDIKVDRGAPFRRQARALFGGLALLDLEERRLLGGADIAPVPQAPATGDEIGAARNQREERRIDRLARHDWSTSATASSSMATRSGASSPRADLRKECGGSAKAGCITCLAKTWLPPATKAPATKERAFAFLAAMSCAGIEAPNSSAAP